VIALDASALLCFMFQEKGCEQVSEYLAEACLSTVNLSEVIGRFTRDGHDAEIVTSNIRSTAIQIIPFDETQATIAASIQTHHSISGPFFGRPRLFVVSHK
jgi:PIN domain nuclease of toxin-antitoxin system